MKSNTIIVTGPPPNVEDAKKALMEKLEELEAEKANKEAKSFMVKVEIKPEYHPKIIGRKGAVINKLREDHDVNINLPPKDSPDDSIITITGYESNAYAAKEAILKIVNDFESMVKEEVEISSRVHSMIIGRRGTGIRKIMSDYNVDIKLPRPGDANPDLVSVTGSDEDQVSSCVKHLLSMAEDFMDDADDWMGEYIKNPTREQEGHQHSQKNEAKGFQVVKGAPWQGASDEAFPTLGGPGGSGSSVSTPVWGPRR
jgi:predicted PilT family ATPase